TFGSPSIDPVTGTLLYIFGLCFLQTGTYLPLDIAELESTMQSLSVFLLSVVSMFVLSLSVLGKAFDNESLEDASDACALANIHALAFSMSFQEGFTSLSLHPDFEPQNLPLSFTAGATKGTASEVPVVSTAEENLSTAGRTVTYTRRSEEKRTRQDKGKAIMIESEPKKKSKKELEQERLSFAEAIRLEEQMNEEQRAQIARDEEIARQWDKEERQRAMSEAKSTKKIDWNDPSVIRYHALKMKPKTIAQARRNMIKYLKNQGNYKISDFKGMSYNEIRPIFEKV
ncbi:hypothetical protein Tco_1100833, partial [Tanacetum coccineum]